jgi:hypothetical protein
LITTDPRDFNWTHPERALGFFVAASAIGWWLAIYRKRNAN